MAIDEKKLLASLARHEDEAMAEMENLPDDSEDYHYYEGQAVAYYEIARLIRKGIWEEKYE